MITKTFIFQGNPKRKKPGKLWKMRLGSPLWCVGFWSTKRAYCRWEDSELYRWMTEGYQYDIEAVGDLKKIKDEIVKISLYHQSGWKN